MDPRQLTAVILAGGQGTRLRPLTLTKPKPTVPLLNIPFLAYQLDLLAQHGITEVILSCSYLVEEVRRTMGDGAVYGVHLRYAVETEPLGTAGGIRNSVNPADSGLVIVLNGDILTDADLGALLAFHAERTARVTIYLTRVPDPTRYGLVELGDRGRIRDFVEKPDPARVTTDTINAGVYVLDRALLARIPPGRMVSIEREIFPALVGDGVPCYGWIGSGYWIDIGSPEKYRQAQLDLLAGRVATRVTPAGPWMGGRWIADGVTLGPTVTLVSPCVIGAGSRLDPECRVGPNAVLGEDCSVGRGAVVEGAVLWEQVDVGERALLRDCIVGSGARVGAGAQIGPGVVLRSDVAVPDYARLWP
ncbi:MAG TPA: NDP-sugar synthase [Methylomirabilota bacterium]|nr:NDP-sugar synthase [Methylomirabilota bacterium]